MKIKTFYACFFKDSLNKRAVTPTFELDEGNISIFSKFENKHGSTKTVRTQFPISFYKVRQPSELEVKFMSKCYTLGEKEGANHPPKGPQTQ